MTYKEFREQMRVEWYLCLPAGASSRDYRGLLQEQDGECLFFLSDGEEHLTAMPYLDVREAFARCGGRFDLPVLKGIFAEYIEDLAEAERADKKEQELFGDLLKIFPEEKIISILVPYRGKEPATFQGNVFQGNIFPGRRYGNAYLQYAVLPDGAPVPGGSVRTAAVTEAMTEKWGVTEQTLFAAAEKNTPGLFPYDIRELSGLPGANAYIVTNESRCFGLSAALYKEGPLKELSMNTGGDYYVFPLSVHEAAAFPVSGLLQEAELSALAGEISPYGREVWYYRKECGRIAFTKEERFLQEAALKNGVPDAADKRRGMDGAFR